MSYSQPLFHGGMYGKANAVVCNGWQSAANATQRFGEAMQWADQQVIKGQIVTQGLCEVVSATLISGAANRWNYTIKIWTPAGVLGTGITLSTTDSRFSYTNCRNIREEHNLSNFADGMSLTSPPASIGPVGSNWSGSAWTTTALEAKVLVYVVYDSFGKAYPFFDRPNPIRCT
jgi:hypothetical protein